VDLDALREEVGKAREGILFLMFMPSATGLFSTVASRSAEPNLYVRGVVSELPQGRDDSSTVDIGLVDGGEHRSLHLDIIHSKVVVIAPSRPTRWSLRRVNFRRNGAILAVFLCGPRLRLASCTRSMTLWRWRLRTTTAKAV
jgi:hypothetical protein